MAAIDPNRIDISLALLPGESEIVIKDLIEQLTAISAQMRAMMGGDEYAPIQGVMGRQSATASQDRPINVNILSVSPTASQSPGLGVNMLNWPNEERAKEKLGAAEEAARRAGGVVIPPPDAPDVDNASQSSVPPLDDVRPGGGPAPDPVPPGPDGGPPPDDPIDDVVQEEQRKSRIQRAMAAVIVRNDDGTINKRQSWDEARETALSFGVLANLNKNTNGEVDQLRRSFTPGNITDIGLELEGAQASTNYGMGKIAGTENVLPGATYFEAAKNVLGIGTNDSAGGIGVRVEADSFTDSLKMGYLNQDEARTLSHSAIKYGWGEGEAEQDRINYSKVRKQADGGLNNMSASEYSELSENVRRDGASSMKELNDALVGMRKGAEAARMGIDEFRAASVKYAEELKAQGATIGEAFGAGRDFSTLTGLPPEVASQLRKSPMVQGGLAAQGLLPQIQGLASEQQVTDVASEQVRNMYNIFRSQATDTVGKTSAGRGVTISADSKAEAMTASQFPGFTRGAVQKILNLEKGGTLDKREEALTNLDIYGTQVADLEKNLKGDDLLKARDAIRTGEGAQTDSITRPEIMKSLQKAGVSEKARKHVSKSKSATVFQREAREALADVTSGDTKDPAKNDETINDKISVNIDLRMKDAAKFLFKDQSIQHNAYRKANRERDSGRNTHANANPDGDPPSKGIQSMLEAIIGG